MMLTCMMRTPQDQMALDLTLAYPTASVGTASYDHHDEMLLQQEFEEQKPLHQVWSGDAALVPSQWKLGAALDRLRFPEYSGDWDTMIAKVTGRPYEQTFPRATSPLGTEDSTRECLPLRRRARATADQTLLHPQALPISPRASASPTRRGRTPRRRPRRPQATSRLRARTLRRRARA